MRTARAPETSARYRFGWHPTLDGVRGLAALVVVVYHTKVIPSFVGAGQASMEVFFVLSGFLITSVLRQDLTTLGRIRLRRFYVRRARRLYPALLVYSTVSAAIAVALWWSPAAPTFWSALASVTYVMNWAELRLSVPVFFGHTWSLAIEEQFYLTWPLLLLAVAAAPPRWRGRLLLLLLTASAAVRFLVVEGGGIERVRNGTDARAMGFLLGGLVALALEGGHPRVERVLAHPLTAAVGVIAVAAPCVLVEVYDPAMFVTWMVAAALGSALLVGHGAVADSCGTRTFVTAALSSRAMVALGAVSYSLYLWHALVLEALRRSPVAGLGRAPLAALGIGLSLLVAAGSLHFVERPFRAPPAPPESEPGSPGSPAEAEYDPRPVTPDLDPTPVTDGRHG